MRRCIACNGDIRAHDMAIGLLALLPAEPQAEPHVEPYAAAKT